MLSDSEFDWEKEFEGEEEEEQEEDDSLEQSTDNTDSDRLKNGDDDNLLDTSDPFGPLQRYKEQLISKKNFIIIVFSGFYWFCQDFVAIFTQIKIDNLFIIDHWLG